MSQEQDLAPVKPDIKPGDLIVEDKGEYSMLMDTARFNQAWRVAKMFAESKLVPAHFQGSTASVFVALHMAIRLNLDPMMLMQNTYLVGNRPGMEAKLIIGLVNARGPFKGPIQWELKGEGKDRQCTAYAIHRETGERCEATVTWKMVEDEGWNKDKQYRDGGGVQKSKWNTMPEMMLRYRSAAFLARLYCPEVIMGLSTVDELEDINGGVVDLQAQPEPPAIEKKPLAEKIKEELKTRKPRSDRGVTRSTRTGDPEKAGETTGVETENAPETPTDFLSDAQGRRIEELLKDPTIIDAGYSKETVCHEWEVKGVEFLNPEQAGNVIKRLEEIIVRTGN